MVYYIKELILSTIVVGTLTYYYVLNTPIKNPTIHKLNCEPTITKFCN
jgi:hypothetical protein